jgi:arabinose-5-phosphate isomerase
MIAKINDDRALALARDVLDIEADAVRALRDQLDGGFVQAVALLLGCRGRVVVSGIGKSGHIARKIAASATSGWSPPTTSSSASPIPANPKNSWRSCRS